MKHHTIAGGGHAKIHVAEAGNPRGRSILFLHGISQCWLQWSRQLESELTKSYRLLAMDMRGHGASEAPRDGYDDSRLWADDVDAVIRQLELDSPVLCGWSYGPLVILDYIRHHGDAQLGGIQLVGAVTKLGSEAAAKALTPEFVSLVPGLFSTEAEGSVRALEGLLRLCFAKEPSAAELYLMLGYSVAVRPSVRQALLSRVIDNDDILPGIRCPVLLTHGARDAIVRVDVVEQHRAQVAHAEVDIVAGAGHAPFWDDAPRFNRRLAAFCEGVASAKLLRV